MGDDEYKADADKIAQIVIDRLGITEAAKPDFLDLDGDGDKEEPMKKAAKDKKKDDGYSKMMQNYAIVPNKRVPGRYEIHMDGKHHSGYPSEKAAQKALPGVKKMSKTTDKEEVAEDMAWLRKAAGIGSGAKSNHGIYEGEEGYQITPRSLVAREMRKLQDIAKD